MSLLTDQLRGWIGREVTYVATEPVSRASIRYFAEAMGDQDRTYRDADYAKSLGFRDVPAPPTFICETNQFIPGSRDEEGYIGHLWDLPVEGCRLIRGGNKYKFNRRLFADDVVTTTWCLTDIVERESSKGLPMLVVSNEATYSDANGEVIATNTETLIYQAVAK